MKEITYILGAGASCKSMPLVANFQDRLLLYCHYTTYTNNLPSGLPENVKEFESKVSSHFSFDTFFKKLFHQSNSDELLNKYKKLLFQYFLFEHMVDVDVYPGTQIVKKLKEKGLQKQYKIDPRYEALIASLIKPIRNKVDFYAKVNFITWNYDVNLLFAIYNFLAPESTFSDFVKIHKTGNSYVFNDQLTVYHMNGCIEHDMLNYLYSKESLEIFKEGLKTDISTAAMNLNFAWEQPDNNFTELASAITRSSNIIIIGYSLPLYNRQIDLKYLHASFMSKAEIVVQDLNANEIKEILQNDFGVIHFDANSPTITTVENCRSFYVPKKLN